MTLEEWLGSENQIGIDIWHKKYQYNGESFDEWVTRIANGNPDYEELIRTKKFLPGGRILSNRGLYKDGIKTTYSNCYVIPAPEDNIESIFDTAKLMARTYSYGGGVGIDISKLAPSGAHVNNAAKQTSGATSFMDLYSLTTGLIGQNGRRGALMISLDCSHPDVMDFIKIKSDLDRVRKANISVRVSDEFMEAVKNDADFELKFDRPETNESIRKVVKAKEVFDELCYQNWDYAEPGILFWDNIKNWNLLSNNSEFSYAGVNPCLTGDTLISTVHGNQPIKDLVGTQPYVYCRGEDGKITIRQASKVWMTRRNATIVKVITKRGELKCTPDHRILTQNRGWVEAQDLKHGDKVVGLNRMMNDETHVAVALSGQKNYVAEHRLVASAFYDINGKDVHHRDGDTFNNDIDNLEVLSHSEHSKITNLGQDRDEMTGQFVAKDIKDKKKSINLGQGVETNWFVDRVEFLEEKEDVYDMTVPELHNFVANRIVVHNCAEEPLPAGGSCLLGSINLSVFVKDGKFDFEDFRDTARKATGFLNEILEEGLPLHPLTIQQETVRDWKQIGLTY